MTTNYEKIKAMSIDEMAEWFNQRASVCELDKPCKNCINNQWCSAETSDDFKVWLQQETK